eukprot:5967515-Alexandrium_andersonii.AAC.1
MLCMPRTAHSVPRAVVVAAVVVAVVAVAVALAVSWPRWKWAASSRPCLRLLLWLELGWAPRWRVPP